MGHGIQKEEDALTSDMHATHTQYDMQYAPDVLLWARAHAWTCHAAAEGGHLD